MINFNLTKFCILCLIPSNDAYEILDNICTCIHENFSISDTVPLKVSSHKGWDSNTKGEQRFFVPYSLPQLLMKIETCTRVIIISSTTLVSNNFALSKAVKVYRRGKLNCRILP